MVFLTVGTTEWFHLPRTGVEKCLSHLSASSRRLTGKRGRDYRALNIHNQALQFSNVF